MNTYSSNASFIWRLHCIQFIVDVYTGCACSVIGFNSLSVELTVARASAHCLPGHLRTFYDYQISYGLQLWQSKH